MITRHRSVGAHAQEIHTTRCFFCFFFSIYSWLVTRDCRLVWLRELPASKQTRGDMKLRRATKINCLASVRYTTARSDGNKLRGNPYARFSVCGIAWGSEISVTHAVRRSGHISEKKVKFHARVWRVFECTTARAGLVVGRSVLRRSLACWGRQ